MKTRSILPLPLTLPSSSPAQFNDVVNVVFSSPVLVGSVVAYFLDSTLSRGDSNVRRDRGWHWWAKFRTFDGDSRSEEFYSLPYNLSKYFPSY